MNLTEEQKALYRAVADGKRVEFRYRVTETWEEWTIDTDYQLGSMAAYWRIAPDSITITIPRPEVVSRDENNVYVRLETEADAQAFIDAVRGAK